MRISYVTEYDALDVHNWSGLGFNIAKALENQHAQINYIGSLKSSGNLVDLLKKIAFRASGKTYLITRSVVSARKIAEKADRQLNKNTEIVFSPGTLPIALMKSHYPKVFYTDATFAGLIDFYPDFFNLSKETIKMGHYLEQKALDNCVLAIYASEWAAKTAVENYQVDPRKIKIVPFGANLNNDRSFDNIRTLVNNRSKTVCKLLFLGVDWKRKGGDLSLKIAVDLFNLGVSIELHVAGVDNLNTHQMPSFVINHGFISKSTVEGSKKIDKLLAESHFLILPSLADCSPLVLNEAASFGLPALTTDVGGISSIVKNGINGRVFTLGTGSIHYAEYIYDNFRNIQKYQQLAFSSFREYEKRLNWNVAGRNIIKMLESQI